MPDQALAASANLVVMQALGTQIERLEGVCDADSFSMDRNGDMLLFAAANSVCPLPIDEK